MKRRLLSFLASLPAIGFLEVLMLVAIVAVLCLIIGAALCLLGSHAAGSESVMAANLLVNPGFEQDWGDASSHQCLILPAAGESYFADIGNIFTPPGWVTWFVHDPGVWDQPEVRDAWASLDPIRVHSGDKAELLFTFYRRHDAGFYQQISVQPGTPLQLTAWAHAWSNVDLPGHHDCFNDARCSAGVGWGPAFILDGDEPPLNGNAWNDAIGNFTFWVGIDPTGGVDPRVPTVVWGQGAHIYNAHAQVPAVEAIAESGMVTVFLRSRTLWAFMHNDAYWDDARVEPIWRVYLPQILKDADAN